MFVTRSTLHVSLGLCVITLSACGGGDGSQGGGAQTAPTVGQQIEALEANGTLPKLDRSSDLAGTDADRNGIRDDIDAYIASRPYTTEQKASLGQLAKAVQAEILVNLGDRVAMDGARLADARAVQCAFLRFPDKPDPTLAGTVAQDIEKFTTDTKQRLLVYLAFAKASNGVVLPSPEGNTCD